MPSYYEFPRIKETVNGKELAIWGVEHTREFFIKHEKLFRVLVSENDAVVLEGISNANFWVCPNFFNDVAEITKEQRKKVYEVDPKIKRSQNEIAQPYADALEVATYALGLYSLIKGVRNSGGKQATARRNFLKRMAKIAVGISLTAGTLPVKCLQFMFSPNTAVTY